MCFLILDTNSGKFFQSCLSQPQMIEIPERTCLKSLSPLQVKHIFPGPIQTAEKACQRQPSSIFVAAASITKKNILNIPTR